MRRSWIVVALSLAVVAGAAAAWLLRQPRPPWSTDSAAALAAFEAGEEASSRLYLADARDRFLEAHQLDPDFVMAKLRLVWHRDYGLDPEERRAMLAELHDADVDRLTRRERFLLAYRLAVLDGRGERAEALLADYLGHRPKDPYAVQLDCERHWLGGEWGAARDCYQRLIELDPNRLEAQNRIGYVSMATGDFATAEQQFEIYRYLAPDQANPYDSLGELMMITGRYREAETQLRQALELKPDFCSSWRNLVRIRLLEGDPSGAAAVIEEMRTQEGTAVCVGAAFQHLACELDVWREMLRRDWEAAWQHAGGCPRGHIAFLAATYSGRDEEARKITGGLHDRIAGTDRPPPVLLALTDQQQAYTALYAGDAETAVARAEAADRRLLYWSLDDQWLLKLLNGQLLADSLAAAGREEEAARARAGLAAVNRRFAEQPPIPAPPPPPAAAGRGASAR